MAVSATGTFLRGINLGSCLAIATYSASYSLNITYAAKNNQRQLAKRLAANACELIPLVHSSARLMDRS